MRERHRFYLLLAVMGVLIVGVGAILLVVLYDAAFEVQRARLLETARGQARLAEAVARFDQEHVERYPGGPIQATLVQLRAAHERFEGFGETGEFTLARREGDRIVFLLTHRHGDDLQPPPVPFDGIAAEPMRRALSGKSGSGVLLDYRGVEVLAAYEPVAVLDGGIVAKVDLSEIREPFVTAGLLAGGGALLLIVLCAAVFLRISDPLLRGLREREAKYRALFENATDAVVVFDGVFVDCNEQACRFYGGTREEIVGRGPVDFSPEVQPDGRASAEAARGYIEAAMGGEPQFFYWRHQQLDGTLAEAEVSLSAAEFGGRQALIANVRDIGTRLRVRSALVRTEAELARYASITDVLLTVPDDEVYSEVLDVVLDALESDYGVLGYIDKNGDMVVPTMTHGVWDECEVPDKRYVFLRETWGDSSWPRAVREKRVVFSNEPSIGLPEGHIPMRRHISLPILYRDVVIGLFQVANKKTDYDELDVEKLQAIARHIAPILHARLQRNAQEAERVLLEGQLRHAQKMETIGTLAGGIAHDFNNLLSPIMGYTDMALASMEKGSRLHGYLEHVVKATKRSESLVRQILTFSRQVEHELRPIRIQEVVAEALKLLRSTLPSSIQIHHDVGLESGTILADETQVHQVLMNLCANAAHAMGEHGGSLRVALGPCDVGPDLARTHPTLHVGSYARLTVADTGSGMDASTRDRIFEPFFSTKGVGEGTGLGLAVVHGIVAAHEGAITVDSEQGVGTTFAVYFPHVADEEADAAPPQDPVPRGTERILLVDDEPEVALLVEQMLQSVGYDVLTVTDGEVAIQTFRARPERFDLVLSDQVMPGMTGDLLARELKRARPDVPVVLMTGHSEVVMRSNVASLGVHALLHKPIVRRDLAVTVRGALDAPST